jgi:hypothetical protein
MPVFQEQGRTGEQVEMKRFVEKAIVALILGAVLLMSYLFLIDLLGCIILNDEVSNPPSIEDIYGSR